MTMTLAQKINTALDAGKTVTIATYTKVLTVKPKHRQAWRNAGFEFFKTDATGATLMIGGQSKGRPRYVCIDWCKITAS
jgi:hypothetical protein